MQRLHYTGDTFLIPDAVSEALLAYASALAEAHTSDVVVVPIADEDGVVTNASILLGPASQLFATEEPDVPESDGHAALVADLHVRAERLRPPKAGTMASEPIGIAEFDF